MRQDRSNVIPSSMAHATSASYYPRMRPPPSICPPPLRSSPFGSLLIYMFVLLPEMVQGLEIHLLCVLCRSTRLSCERRAQRLTEIEQTRSVPGLRLHSGPDALRLSAALSSVLWTRTIVPSSDPIAYIDAVCVLNARVWARQGEIFVISVY